MCLTAVIVFVALPVTAKMFQETGSLVVGGLVGLASCALLSTLILLLLDNKEWGNHVRH
jgi:hypothetical protein